MLLGLVSLGFNPTVADLAEFAAGFAAMTFVTPDEARDALLLFDALGWARPAGDEPPLFARAWFATGQGRAAAEGTFAVPTTSAP